MQHVRARIGSIPIAIGIAIPIALCCAIACFGQQCKPTEQSPLDELLTRIVLKNIPHEYSENKKWGLQKKRWNGIKFRREGLKIETERKWKMVNHGTWRKYATELIDPEKKFSVEMRNARNTDGGKTAFDLIFSAHLKIHAREAKWVNGVQLYSISADGHAYVRLTIGCETRVSLDLSNFPPDLVLHPVVTKAHLSIDEFYIDRISKLGGEFSQQVAKNARKKLDEKIESKQQKLVVKINQQLKRNQKKFRLSISQAIKTKWFKQAKEFLPEEVRNATEK